MANAINMPKRFAFDDKLDSHLNEQLNYKIELYFVVAGFCVCDDVMSDAHKSKVKALHIKPICLQFNAVCVVDWENIPQNSARKISGSYFVDGVAAEK